MQWCQGRAPVNCAREANTLMMQLPMQSFIRTVRGVHWEKCRVVTGHPAKIVVHPSEQISCKPRRVDLASCAPQMQGPSPTSPLAYVKIAASGENSLVNTLTGSHARNPIHRRYSPTGAECLDCVAGFYTGVSVAGTVCTSCDGGSFSAGRAMNCTLCAEGFYSGTQATSCSACETGKYNDAKGASLLYTLCCGDV